MQKNGGNVVSYFLTPEGLVINAVVGPVKADKLLAEARWSVDTYQKALGLGRRNIAAQAAFIAAAHQALSGDRVHNLLADNSLLPLPLIQQRVFEKLAGQKASLYRGQVELAAAAFDKAQQKGMPVLLLLTKAQAKPGQLDLPAERLLAELGERPVLNAARNCVLVILPIDELPALTNLVKLPELNLAERTTPTIVLAKGEGAQIAAISAMTPPREIARQLWDAVNQSRLEKAEGLIAAGKTREATSLLRLVKSSPQAGTLKERASERLADLQKRASSPKKTPEPA